MLNKKHLPMPRLEGGVECQIEGGIVNRCLEPSKLVRFD
ncbi:hypothetical protein THZG08_100118 [Vibrio owensii]|nr:hypothetical protein THZG08_100118 [Vibrio owensii]CAH1549742.1 hypothetical protein THOA03_100119 [Vibrio owensii]